MYVPYYSLSSKEEGNNFYRSKDYAGSIVAYTKAVTLCPESPIYLMNRAAAYLMTLQFKEVYSHLHRS
jgi:hypothetical protein